MSSLRFFVLLFVFLSTILPSAAQVTEPVDLDLYSTLLYVSAGTGSDVTGVGTQVSPYQSIQRAISSASVVSETAVAAILVASGTYTSESAEVVKLTPWIDLYGGFEPVTWARDISACQSILDGENERVVLTGASNTRIDGVVLTGGRNTYGAVLFSNLSAVVLSNCIVRNNGTEIDGSGLYTYNSSVEVSNCSFLNNHAYRGGAIYLNKSTASIEYCTIDGNSVTTSGGGIVISRSTATVSSCTITHNYTTVGNGGGISSDDNSNTSVTNSIIANNTSYGYGGGIYTRGAILTVINCTIFSNTSFREGGGIAFWDCSPQIYNSILGNQGDEIFKYSSGTATVRYSCIQGGYSGEGNIDSFPNFESVNSDNYRLKNGSPCIDSGSVDLAPSKDLDGIVRPGVDGKVDMGAYESIDSFERGDISDPTRLFVSATASPSGTGLSWAEALSDIADAISLAPTGSEIWVAGGEYSGPLTLQTGCALIGGFAGTESSLSERNLAQNHSIITADESYPCTVVGSEESTLDGFTLSGSDGGSDIGLYFMSVTSATVMNCVIQDFSSSEDIWWLGAGMYCYAASPHIVSCTFQMNTSVSNGGAGYLEESSPVFEQCSFKDNFAKSCGAFYIYRSSPIFNSCIMTGNSAAETCPSLGIWTSSPSFYNCTISGNKQTENVSANIVCGDSSLLLRNTIVWNTGPEVDLDSSTIQADYCCIQGGWPGTENISSYPKFTDPDSGIWTLQMGSPCIDSGTIDLLTPFDVRGKPRPGGDGKIDIGAYESPDEFLPGSGVSPSRLYVSASITPGGDGSSWTQALPSIGEALWMSGNNSEIWVAIGTYKESNIIMESGVKVYGGFGGNEEVIPEGRGLSTIDASLDSTNPVISAAEDIILDHFLLTGESQSNYGALSFYQINSATVTNCVITGNHSYIGGGVFCESSSPILIDCTISDNMTSGGGSGLYCLYNSSPHLLGCTISGNTGGGGGIYCSSASAIVEQCTISGNTAPSTYGGGIYIAYSPKNTILTNCVIVDNYCGKSGGAIYFTRCSGNLTLKNCTLAGNKSGDNTGGIYSDSSAVIIMNSILCNSGSDMLVSGKGTTSVRYSCIQGGYTGTGNIDSSPLFQSPGSGDYHLLNGSPCIDSASVSLAPSVDLDGNIRPGTDGKVDMGAYESPDDYQGGSSTESVRFYVNAKAAPGGSGMSWGQAFTEILEAVQYASGNAEIWVASGTYSGPVQLEAGSSLYGGFAGTETQLSERDPGINRTVIDGAGTNQSAFTGAADTLIDGFTITGGEATNGGGLYYSSVASATITNCIIENNTAVEAGGAAYLEQSSPTFQNCLFRSNSAQAGGALACIQSSPSLINCILASNSALLAGAGLYCDDSFPSLTHCTIAGNAFGLYAATGIYCTGSTLNLKNSILWNLGAEIRLDSSTAQVSYSCVQGGWPGKGNIQVYPAFVGATTGDWHLMAGSPCIDSATIDARVTGDYNSHPRPGGDNKADMGAYESADDLTPSEITSPARLFVNSAIPQSGDGLSWDQAFQAISEALWLTGGNSEIWLASGTYSEAVWLEPGVSIQGGLSGNEETLPQERGTSTIDATLHSPYRPVTAAEGVMLEHLLITGAMNSYEGALYFDQVNSATVSSCMITGNTTEYAGGVLCAYSSPTLIDCGIMGNWTALGAGGVNCDVLSSPHLVRCTIAGNHTETDGGGLVCMTASPLIEQCTISGNSSKSYGGGIMCDMDSRPVFKNCLVTGNAAYAGAGMISTDSQPELINCTLAGNIADPSREGILLQNSLAVLTNCIHWDNVPARVQIQGATTSNPLATYCDIEGGWPGAGHHNLNQDPLFAGTGNYHLLAASPCINSGTGPAASSLIPEVDIDGDIRSGLSCDIGADEYTGPTTIIDWFNY